MHGTPVDGLGAIERVLHRKVVCSVSTPVEALTLGSGDTGRGQMKEGGAMPGRRAITPQERQPDNLAAAPER